MNKLPPTISKQTTLKPAEDYYRLRREGIGFIEQMGSRLWTDYNTHDPGITILEALCYAITDLAFRTGWDIKDLLTPATPSADQSQPFPSQPFFTARDILTVNPTTSDDFRRLLIDLETVRNAWIFCKDCTCDLYYYAWCEKDQLILAYEKSAIQADKVKLLGLYDVLLELESDPELGDLNDRKIEQNYDIFDADGKPHTVIMELRFPEWGLEAWDEWKGLLKIGQNLKLKVTSFGANKTYNMLKELEYPKWNRYLLNHWRNVFYVSFEVELPPGFELPADINLPSSLKKIAIKNVALRLYGDAFVKSELTFDRLQAVLEDKKIPNFIETPSGFIPRYCNKIFKVEKAVTEAKESLYRHRNLDEDLCRVKVVGIEEVAVCADVEVNPDADIELVQARIWFEIEQYFNPPVPFYTLQELQKAGEPVEDIFNGPKLESGFIKTRDLEKSSLKSVLRVSDIINRLMDIDGVIAVNQMQLTKYDSEGNVIKGYADPELKNGERPGFDANKISASWLLYISKQHQPRLYLNGSRFLFFKNGLPFKPRMDEACDTLTQLRGEAERPKIKSAPKDLSVPVGTFRDPEDYFPVQYSFPLAYGIGPDGLPGHASAERRAQAKQLKAYLMVFEQFLGNAFAQVAHFADLFSLDPNVERTYFVKAFNEEIDNTIDNEIKGYDEIVNALNKAKLEAMAETVLEFHERRNRFLDHILARFGEQFSEYALLLTNLQGQQVALDRLIDDKISFLKAYRLISRDRAKAINYKDSSYSSENQAGIKKRVSRLLGYPDLVFDWMAVTDLGADKFRLKFQLLDQSSIIFRGYLNVNAQGVAQAKLLVRRAVVERMSLAKNYQIAKKTIVNEPDKFILRLKGKVTEAHGRHPDLLATRADAEAIRDELLAWSANERMIVVEHLLLRPKFHGDALYPACLDGACQTCGDEDPYSFRLTFVMPGWTTPYNTNLDMRGFADRTIRQETPSHLLAKICWVGNDGFIENLCEPVIIELTDLLVMKGMTIEGSRPTEIDACICATAIYDAFSDIFRDWYDDKTYDYFHPDALKKALEVEFSMKIHSAAISCTTVLETDLWTEVQTIMVKYFHHIALHGWQFERFEDAWCKWLEANARFDWTEERLPERIEAILANNLAPNVATNKKDKVCECAADILAQYGQAFYDWMNWNFKEGNALNDFRKLEKFSNPDLTLCPDFFKNDPAIEQIFHLLKERYTKYVEVSYRLWIVVSLLSKMSNTYPPATLHDWDEGSDQNPVRLGKTALGS